MRNQSEETMESDGSESDIRVRNQINQWDKSEKSEE